MTGFEIAFEHQGDGTYFLETHHPIFRQVDYIYGLGGVDRGEFVKMPGESSVEDHYYDQRLHQEVNKTYVTVTCSERRMYTEIYKGEFFSADDFRYLDRQSGINKPITTGCFDLYLVR